MIIGLGEAARITAKNLSAYIDHFKKIRNHFEQKIKVGSMPQDCVFFKFLNAFFWSFSWFSFGRIAFRTCSKKELLFILLIQSEFRIQVVLHL